MTPTIRSSHGEGAVRRVHAAGVGHGVDRPDRLPQHPRHLHPAGRRGRTRRSAPCSATRPPPCPRPFVRSFAGRGQACTGAIYSLLMMEGNFIAVREHRQLDPEVAGYADARESRENVQLLPMSNSFGFGGTNATLVFGKVWPAESAMRLAWPFHPREMVSTDAEPRARRRRPCPSATAEFRQREGHRRAGANSQSSAIAIAHCRLLKRAIAASRSASRRRRHGNR